MKPFDKLIEVMFKALIRKVSTDRLPSSKDDTSPVRGSPVSHLLGGLDPTQVTFEQDLMVPPSQKGPTSPKKTIMAMPRKSRTSSLILPQMQRSADNGGQQPLLSTDTQLFSLEDEEEEENKELNPSLAGPLDRNVNGLLDQSPSKRPMVLDVYVSGNLETIHMRDLEEKLSRLKRFEGAYPELARSYQALAKKCNQIEAVIKTSTPLIEGVQTNHDLEDFFSFMLGMKKKYEDSVAEVSVLQRKVAELNELKQLESTAKIEMFTSLHAKLNEKDEEISRLNTLVSSVQTDAGTMDSTSSSLSGAQDTPALLRQKVRDLAAALKKVTDQRNKAIERCKELSSSSSTSLSSRSVNILSSAASSPSHHIIGQPASTSATHSDIANPLANQQKLQETSIPTEHPAESVSRLTEYEACMKKVWNTLCSVDGDDSASIIESSKNSNNTFTSCNDTQITSTAKTFVDTLSSPTATLLLTSLPQKASEIRKALDAASSTLESVRNTHAEEEARFRMENEFLSRALEAGRVREAEMAKTNAERVEALEAAAAAAALAVEHEKRQQIQRDSLVVQEGEDALQMRLADSEAVRASLETTIVSLRKELQDITQVHGTAIVDLEARIQSFERQLEQQRVALNVKEAELAQKEQILLDSLQELERLREESATEKAMAGVLQENIVGMEKMYKDALSSLTSREAEVASLKLECEKLANTVANLNLSNEALQSRSRDAEQSLVQALANLDQTKLELSHMQADKDQSIERVYSELQAMSSTASTTRLELTTKCKELESQVACLESDLVAARVRVSESEAVSNVEKKSLADDLVAMTAQARLAESTLQSLESGHAIAVKEYETQITALKKSIHLSEVALVERQHEIDRLSTSYRSVSEELTVARNAMLIEKGELDNDLAAKTAALIAAESKLQSTSTKLADLHTQLKSLQDEFDRQQALMVEERKHHERERTLLTEDLAKTIRQSEDRERLLRDDTESLRSELALARKEFAENENRQQEHAELMARLGKTEGRLDEEKAENSRLSEDLLKSKQILEDAVGREMRLQQQLTAIQTELSKKSENEESASTKLEACQRVCSELELRVTGLNQQVADSKDEFAKSSSAMDQLKVELASRLEQVTKLQQALNDSQRTSKELEHQLKGAVDNNIAVELEKDRAYAEIKVAHQKLSEEMVKLALLQAEVDQLKISDSRMKDDLSEKSLIIATITTERDGAKEELSKIVYECDRLSKVRDELHETLQRTSQELSLLKSKNQQLEAKVERSVADLALAESAKQQLQADLASNQTNLKCEQDRVESSRLELEKCQKRLASQAIDMENLQTKADSLSRDLESNSAEHKRAALIEKDLSVWVSNCKELESKLASSHSVISELELKFSKMVEENRALQHRLEEERLSEQALASESQRLSQKLKDEESRVEVLNIDIISLRNHVSELAGQLDVLRNEHDFSLQQLKMAISEKLASEKVANSLQQGMSELESRTRSSEQALELSKQTVLDLNRSLAECNNSLEQVRAQLAEEEDKNLMSTRSSDARIKELENLLKSKESGMYFLKSELTAVKEQAENDLSAKRMDLDKCNHEVSDLRAKINEQRDEIEELKTQKQESENQVQNMRLKSQDLSLQVSQLMSERNSLKEAISQAAEKAQMEGETKELMLSEQEIQLSTLPTRVNELQTRIVELEAQLLDSKQQLQRKCADADELKLRVSDLEREAQSNAQLLSAMDQLKSELADKVREQKKAEKDVRDANTLMMRVEEDLLACRGEVDREKEALNLSRSRISELEEKESNWLRQAEDKERELDRRQTELQDAESRLNAKLEEKEKVVDELKQKELQLSKLNKALKEEVRKLSRSSSSSLPSSVLHSKKSSTTDLFESTSNISSGAYSNSAGTSQSAPTSPTTASEDAQPLISPSTVNSLYPARTSSKNDSVISRPSVPVIDPPNIEYLRNVFVKFVESKKDKRALIIPALSVILQLSPEEVKKFHNI